MTTDTNLLHVLEAVRGELGDPATWGSPIDLHESLALSALNSAYSLRATSTSVRNVIRRYRDHRFAMGANPDTDDAVDLLALIDRGGGPVSFSTKVLKSKAAFPKTGKLRLEAIYDALTNLRKLNVISAKDLVASADVPEVKFAWCSVKGLGELSWEYVLMNSGDTSRTKVDVKLERFLNRATGTATSSAEGKRLVIEAAKTLGVAVRDLDRAIWLHETPNEAAS